MLEIVESILIIAVICSALVFLFAAILNKRIKRQQIWCALVPFVLLLSVIAYKFDYISNPNNDLSRFISDFIRIKSGGFWTKLYFSNDYEIVYRIIAFLASRLNNFHWYPFATVLFEYTTYIVILKNESQYFENQGLGLLTCIVFKMSLMSTVMSISGSRNTIAYTFVALGIYILENHNKNNKLGYALLVAGGLTHTGVILGIAVYFISKFLKNRQIFAPLFLIFGGMITGLSVILASINGPFWQFIYGKSVMYLAENNFTNNTKTHIMLPFVILLSILCMLHIVLRRKPLSGTSMYVVAQIFTAIGTGSVIPTLFLRLCYPISILFPILYANIEERTDDESSVCHFLIVSSMILIGGLMFLATGFGWIRELINFISW